MQHGFTTLHLNKDENYLNPNYSGISINCNKIYIIVRGAGHLVCRKNDVATNAKCFTFFQTFHVVDNLN